jgi:hypothetical protein
MAHQVAQSALRRPAQHLGQLKLTLKSARTHIHGRSPIQHPADGCKTTPVWRRSFAGSVEIGRDRVESAAGESGHRARQLSQRHGSGLSHRGDQRTGRIRCFAPWNDAERLRLPLRSQSTRRSSATTNCRRLTFPSPLLSACSGIRRHLSGIPAVGCRFRSDLKARSRGSACLPTTARIQAVSTSWLCQTVCPLRWCVTAGHTESTRATLTNRGRSSALSRVHRLCWPS